MDEKYIDTFVNPKAVNELNVNNKVIQIEDKNGNMLFALEINEDGQIVSHQNVEIADVEYDTIFDSNRLSVRLQAID